MDRNEMLRQWMEEHERGPAWVARKTGYRREWISSVLHGRKPFSDKLVRKITEGLGIKFTEDSMVETTRLDEAVEFAENPEPRCPCVLLLDTSSSMRGDPITALNQGLQAFKEELTKDPLASRRVEVAVVTFDSAVNMVQDFVTADQFDPPTLTAQGATHMGSGMHKGLDMVQARKAQYRDNGIAYFRPWVFMITDGAPQGESEDVVTRAVQRIKDDEATNRVAFFAVGVEGANMTRLTDMVVRTPVKLRGLNFVEMFVWLSRSMEAVAQSKIDDKQVALPPPGWGTV